MQEYEEVWLGTGGCRRKATLWLLRSTSYNHMARLGSLLPRTSANKTGH
jgi:hypothetical protein